MSRPIEDKGIGYVPAPQPVLLSDDSGDPVRSEAVSGKLTQDAVRYLHSVILSLASAVNGRLTLGDGTPGSKAGNLDGQFVPVLTPSVADTEFSVQHGLGRIPVTVLVALSDIHCTIKVSSLGSWSGSKIYLKCSAGSATLRLLLL